MRPSSPARWQGPPLTFLPSNPQVRDHPLLLLDQVIATPHLGASTKEAQTNVSVAAANQIIAYLLNDHRDQCRECSVRDRRCVKAALNHSSYLVEKNG